MTAVNIIRTAADLIDRGEVTGPVTDAIALATGARLDKTRPPGAQRQAITEAVLLLSTAGGIGSVVEWANELPAHEVADRMRAVANFADTPPPIIDHCDHCEQPTGRVMYGGVLLCQSCRNQP